MKAKWKILRSALPIDLCRWSGSQARWTWRCSAPRNLLIYVYRLPGSMSLYLPVRPRRLRQSDAIRRLVAETHLLPGDLIYPLFVHDEKESVEVSSMPGVVRHSVDSLIRECEEALAAGILAVAIFPSIKPGLKNAKGTHGLKDDNLLYRAVRQVKRALPHWW